MFCRFFEPADFFILGLIERSKKTYRADAVYKSIIYCHAASIRVVISLIVIARNSVYGQVIIMLSYRFKEGMVS